MSKRGLPLGWASGPPSVKFWSRFSCSQLRLVSSSSSVPPVRSTLVASGLDAHSASGSVPTPQTPLKPVRSSCIPGISVFLSGDIPMIGPIKSQRSREREGKGLLTSKQCWQITVITVRNINEWSSKCWSFCLKLSQRAKPPSMIIPCPFSATLHHAWRGKRGPQSPSTWLRQRTIVMVLSRNWTDLKLHSLTPTSFQRGPSWSLCVNEHEAIQWPQEWVEVLHLTEWMALTDWSVFSQDQVLICNTPD